MSFHEEILTEKQGQALRLLGPRTAEHGFYLAGGIEAERRVCHNAPGQARQAPRRAAT